MATIREYFDTDVKALTVHTDWQLQDQTTETNITLVAKVALDFEANAKFWYFYVPATTQLGSCLASIFQSELVKRCELGPEGNGIEAEMGHSDYSERQSTKTLHFTNRIHLYVDMDLTRETRASLVSQVHNLGYSLSIRDHEYATKRSESEKPLAFISHDSRDKDSFVRELAIELSRNYCTVWYDEFSLTVGDSLRENIERGLKETRKCIVILSPHFLSNEGWGKAEFDSIFTREIVEKKNVILPVWIDVTVHDVYQYSPRMADKVGISSKLGVQEVARQLTLAIKK